MNFSNLTEKNFWIFVGTLAAAEYNTDKRKKNKEQIGMWDYRCLRPSNLSYD